MARPNFKTVDEYMTSLLKDTQEKLEELRNVIKKFAPSATEVISYQIPTLKLNGIYLIYFAGYKHHVSLYPAPRGVTEFKELDDYKGGKGTVQFPLNKPLPKPLIEKIIEHRIKETEAKKDSHR